MAHKIWSTNLRAILSPFQKEKREILNGEASPDLDGEASKYGKNEAIRMTDVKRGKR
jgi:hypothetical protein